MEVGERIKKLREKKGLSTTDLSRLTGISQSTISKLENGKRKPELSTLEKIADALIVTVDRLSGESASSIIEDKIKELNITLEEVAKKSKVTLRWLENLDSFIPGEADDWESSGKEPHELEWDAKIGGYKSYKWITRVAEVLGLPGSTLRAALARQEIPFDDSPPDTRSVEEIFANEDFDDVLPKQKVDNELTEDQILTLAAHQIGHKGTLTEKELDQIKLAMKIALSKDSN